MNEGKRKRVRERDENGKVQGRWRGEKGLQGGESKREKGISEMERMQQNRPIERSSAEPKFSLADSPKETKSIKQHQFKGIMLVL